MEYRKNKRNYAEKRHRRKVPGRVKGINMYNQHTCPYTKGIQSIAEFKVSKNLRHSNPFPGLNSRLASAEILSYYDIQKEVVKTVVILNRAGRAFILSQGGLPGFLNTHYENMESLLFK